MNLVNSRLLMLPLLMSLLAAAPSQADEPCLKQVFNHYCLGGPTPEGLEADENGRVTIEDAQGNIALQIADNRIIAVSRELQPANWLNFTDLKSKLVRLYRTAADVSDFPRYATSRSSKLNAIRAGRGYAAARWEQQGWAIQLDWRALDSMQLRYELHAPADATTPINTLEGL